MTLPRIDPTPEEQQTAREITNMLPRMRERMQRGGVYDRDHFLSLVEKLTALASARARDQQRIAELTAQSNQNAYAAVVRDGELGAALKRIAELEQALRVECTCRVIEKCERCEAIDALKGSR